MTLEDDVESILSEQFNVSNESMFRVRGEIKMGNAVTAVSASGFGGLGGGGAGDSTYRACDDSMYGYDEDRGLISESDDGGGWYTNTGEKQDGVGAVDNKFDEISEHTSDEITDSDPENLVEGVTKKVKKTKTEKGGEKKKKKKKKVENAENADTKNPEKKDSGGQKLGIAQTYKKLQEETKEGPPPANTNKKAEKSAPSKK